jgi:rsbT co-antagonist protein RsbR
MIFHETPRKHEMSVNSHTKTGLSEILSKHEARLVSDWVKEQIAVPSPRGVAPKESELRKECAEFIGLLRKTLENVPDGNIESPGWSDVREALEHISRSRTAQGCSPSETASFVFSLKKPLFTYLRRDLGDNAQALADETWSTNVILDNLGLYTIEVYQRSREEIITRQQEEMLELSTPVVTLWDGILGLPMIGTLDSARTQIVMESLLQKIVETGSALAIIDITGVPTVDTLTAQHLLKTVTAARLMGAECIISGIRPQIAQTIVHLGVDLGDVITKASLADALALALEKTGRTVTRVKVRK